MKQKKRIVVLGSSGSIGLQAFEVLDLCGDFEVVGAAVESNIEVLERQAKKYGISCICVGQEGQAQKLRQKLKGERIEVLSGVDGMCEMIEKTEPDMVLNALGGMVGLLPTLTAVSCGCNVALANKETLVSAGTLVMNRAKEKKVHILPVDSEHSAIWQCLNGNKHKREVNKLILTASGGPFFGWDLQQQAKVTKQLALKHPNWSMGPKITIDCATLMNKGLELIEAMHLFDMEADKIKVLIHPQSIIHSMVEYIDHSVIAQMSIPDMRLPIHYALHYPNRLVSPIQPLDLAQIGSLSFFEPDIENFPCLKIAMECAKAGGTAPTILNGANEAAVGLFLEDKINFLEIAQLVQMALEEQELLKEPSLEEILEADKKARRFVLTHFS